MPRMQYDAMVVEVGKYGPFDDGRTYDYAVLADGHTTLNATLAQGVEIPPTLVKGVADVEFYANQQGRIKARLHGFLAGKG